MDRAHWHCQWHSPACVQIDCALADFSDFAAASAKRKREPEAAAAAKHDSEDSPDDHDAGDTGCESSVASGEGPTPVQKSGSATGTAKGTGWPLSCPSLLLTRARGQSGSGGGVASLAGSHASGGGAASRGHSGPRTLDFTDASDSDAHGT